MSSSCLRILQKSARKFGSEPFLVVILLTANAGILAFSATRHSPTLLEPAFLVSGISHWEFGRFELYRVNPPLVRMVAALPMIVTRSKVDWSEFYDSPSLRAEFPLGALWMDVNGPQSILLLCYARWACIPFNLIGGYFAFRWAKELYGHGAGLVTLFIWTVEPNLVAHAELITSDCACWSFGVLAGYTFWRWLKEPVASRAALAGLSLGLAELSKLTWLILFGLWPLLWLTWRCLETNKVDRRAPLRQLTGILFLAIYIVNLGYGFDGFGTRLKDLEFVSTTLTGLDRVGQLGNRFRDSWLGDIPVPFPKQYVLGFDSQKKDLEEFHRQSYLRGEWKQGGWWYYYIYGLFVKVPCGLWMLFATITISRICRPTRLVPLRDELVLLLPAVVLLVVVSTQTEFNIHLRYVYPSLALTTIFLGQNFGLSTKCGTTANTFRICMLGYCLISGLLVYPHQLAYFNEFVGGAQNGYRHLLGSSFDWGQDWLLVQQFIESVGRRDETAILWKPLNADTYSPESLGVPIATTAEQCRGYNWLLISYQALQQDVNRAFINDFQLTPESLAGPEQTIVRVGVTHFAIRLKSQ